MKHIHVVKHYTGAQNKTQIERARIIKNTLGTYTAARYMLKRNWTIDAAMFVLCGI